MFNKNQPKNGYTTSGAIRGCCGHVHQYFEKAVECLEKDKKGCKKQGGYSDRSIYKVEDREITEIIPYQKDFNGHYHKIEKKS